MTDAIVVYCTAPNRAGAQKLAKAIVKERLAACVSLVPGIVSHYWWEGRIESGKEVLLVIKSQRRIFQKLSARIHSLHPYSVPEVIAMPVVAGGKKYLDWMAGSLKKAGR